jgi:hypothetical protein
VMKTTKPSKNVAIHGIQAWAPSGRCPGGVSEMA